MSASEENDAGAGLSLSTPPDPFQGEQTVLILVGLIASGKSTFAQALESYFPRFRRCNQDELGNRQQVEGLAYHILGEGRSPCIDRTNFNATQRSYWSAIARAFPGTSISIIVFDTPYHVCASRLERRTWHPTIKNAQHGMTVLQKFASDFQPPSPDEEYDHLIYLRPADCPRPEYTRDDMLAILRRLKASTRVVGRAVTQRSVESYFGHSRSYSRTDRARGQRSGGHQGHSPPGGTLYGSSPFAGRMGGSNGSNWRLSGGGTATNWEKSDHQQSTATPNVPPMESSKGRGSAEERHNST